MKILLLSALYPPLVVGGAEKVAKVIADGLLAAGHEPVVVTTVPEPGVRTATVDGVRVHAIGLKNLYWPHGERPASPLRKAAWHAINSFNPWMARAVGKILHAERPDVVNTHSLIGLSCAVWPTVHGHRIPLVHTIHDYSLLCPKTTMFANGRNCSGQCTSCKVYSQPAKMLSGGIEAVVGVSRRVLDRHLHNGYFAQAATRVIHNGLPPTIEPVVPRTGGRMPLRLGYVGQLVPPKGIADLLATMRRWTSAECQLVVAGKGPSGYERELRGLAPHNVRFLGFVDPREVYGSVDVLVVPSRWEDPLPTIVIEAYMQGLPVIAARRGGLPELVEDGRTGLLYDPDAPDALAGCIGAFLDDPELPAQMAAAIQRKARYLGVDRMRAEYLDVLTQSVERAPCTDRRRWT